MADLNQIEASKYVSLVDEETGLKAKIDLIDGEARVITGGVQAIESLKGFDPQVDVWYYLGTELDSEGIGSVGDQIRMQIAAGDDPVAYPAIDITYTLTAGDVAGTEDQLALTLASYYNTQAPFSTLWRAQRIQGNGVIYLSARKAGGQYERPNSGDFQVSSTGTTVVTAAFDKAIRRNKITGLARDPVDPRQGQLGIQGSVTESEGNVTNRFQEIWDIKVDGSVTPVTFSLPADATQVKFLQSVIISARGSNMKYGQFLSQNNELTNGLRFYFKTNDLMSERARLKSTDDLDDLFAGNPSQAKLSVQAGGDKYTSDLEFSTPIEIRPQGEFVTDDYFALDVEDNLSNGITTIRVILNGFLREF